MTSFDFDQVLTTPFNTPLREQSGVVLASGVPEIVTVTLARACANAVLNPEGNLSESEHMQRDELARKIGKGGKVDLSDSELVLVKRKLLGLPSAFAGQSLRMLLKPVLSVVEGGKAEDAYFERIQGR